MGASRIEIRIERPEDQAAIREVNRQAFGQDAEGHLVDALREDGCFAAEGSLVATLNDEVVGHLLLSRVMVRDPRTGRGSRALALPGEVIYPAPFQRL